MTHTIDPLTYRPRTLIYAILGHVYDADAPVAWLELVDTYSSEVTSWRTVEATIYDLIAYGALHRIGHPAARRRPDTRALKPTALGRAWWEQTETPPLP